MSGKFGELFDYLPKSKFKAGSGLNSGDFPFYTCSDKQTKFLNENMYNGEALIFGTGGNATMHYANNAFAASTDCLVAKPKSSEILAKYVYYYLFADMSILQNGFRGSGLKHISKGFISDIKIPVQSLVAQKQIIHVSDTLTTLISKRKEQIALLDKFLEQWYMNNLYLQANDYEDWNTVRIEELAANVKNSMRTGPFGSNLLHSEFVDEGIAVLGIDNAVNNCFRWKEKRFITEGKYETLRSYTVRPRDVIITIMGTTGRSAVVPDEIVKCINTKHLACLTLDFAKANPYYISYSIHKNPSLLNQIKQQNKGAIMDGLNLTIIKGLNIVLPPIDLQNKFENLYHRLEMYKSRLQLSLAELETTYKAILQKAFNGELFN